MGTSFEGAEAQVVLEWEVARPLAQDEYFEVHIDWNDREANPFRVFTTREDNLRLPGDLLQQPNCHVFDWRVRVMRQTGKSEDGGPLGEAISSNSLYRYLIWRPAAGEAEGSVSACPNAQY